MKNLISLMILSHSPKIAHGAFELAKEMNTEGSIYAIGGTKDGSMGSDYDTTKEKLAEAIKKGDVIILFDLGSTLMTIQMILEELEEEELAKVHLCDAALIEGAIIASATMAAKMPLENILSELKKLSLPKLQ